MRRLMKRVAAAVLMAACLVSLSACTAAKTDETAEAVSQISTDGTPVDDAMSQSIILSATQMLGAAKEQLIVQQKLSMAQGDTGSAEIYQAQLDVREEMGELKDVDIDNGSAVLLADGSYTVMVPVTFTEGTKLYVMNINMSTQQIKAEFTDLSSGEQEDTSVGALLEKATVYSVIGIGTVFAVLIFISLLIYCFKYIHAWEEKMKATASAPAPAAAPVITAAPAAPAQDLMEDEQLVAVITAAIAAFEGTSSNGLVVRSIRRVQGTKKR